MDSLVETMDELETEICVTTETCFDDENDLTEKFEWLRYEEGYGIFTKNRRGRRGGGVAIVYRKGDWVLNEVKTNPDFEVMCTIGRRKSQRRKMAVIGAYLPPSANAAETDSFLSYVAA